LQPTAQAGGELTKGELAPKRAKENRAARYNPGRRTAGGGCPHMLKGATEEGGSGTSGTDTAKPLGSGLNPTAGQRISAF